MYSVGGIFPRYPSIEIQFTLFLGCPYEKGAARLARHGDLYPNGAHEVLFPGENNHFEVWDIEDLVQLGRKNTGCPFFAARTLAKGAEIVFCPYQYLLDPAIRSSLKINFENSVVIIDEAHNVEDTCRETGRFLPLDSLVKLAVLIPPLKISSPPSIT